MSALLVCTVPILCALLYMLATSLHNWRRFPRLGAQHGGVVHPPAVSILIPARNEAAAIGETITHLLAQECDGALELWVLDDESDDGTVAAAVAAGAGDLRLRVLSGKPLQPGWAGKPWACAQLAEAANGELLLFTDADVVWEPGALAAIVAMQTATQADLLTVWPTQVLGTWAERLVVPLMSFAVLAYLPVAWVERLPYASAAAANGQCMLFRRAAYRACGGHEGVRGRVLDDVLLARAVKTAGGELRMADGSGLVRTRMYHNWAEVRDGYAKNILAGHGNSLSLLALSTLAHLAIFVFPWLWLASGIGSGWPLYPLALGMLGIGVRAVTAATARQRLRDSLWMPLSVLLMTRIALQSVWWRFQHGGPRWKERVLLGG